MSPGDLVKLRPGLTHGTTRLSHTVPGILIGPTAAGGVRSDIGCVDVLFSFGMIVVHPDNLRTVGEPVQPAQDRGIVDT
jgi:hypothetical protein